MMLVVTAPEQLRAWQTRCGPPFWSCCSSGRRYYGRVARTLYIGVVNRPEDKQVVAAINGLSEAAEEAAAAHAADELRCTLVHARIPIEEVRTFWAEVQQVARRFAQIPRAGDQAYGFVTGLYPTDAPTLPDAEHDPTD